MKVGEKLISFLARSLSDVINSYPNHAMYIDRIPRKKCYLIFSRWFRAIEKTEYL